MYHPQKISNSINLKSKVIEKRHWTPLSKQTFFQNHPSPSPGKILGSTHGPFSIGFSTYKILHSFYIHLVPTGPVVHLTFMILNHSSTFIQYLQERLSSLCMKPVLSTRCSCCCTLSLRSPSAWRHLSGRPQTPQRPRNLSRGCSRRLLGKCWRYLRQKSCTLHECKF